MRIRRVLLVLATALLLTLTTISPARSSGGDGPAFYLVTYCKSNGTCEVCSVYRVNAATGEEQYLYSTVTCGGG